MELRQLEYLVAVADEAGFTRAAQRTHVTQSGISAQIRRLERELGVTLFDRGARAATPTAAGVVAIAHARRVLAEVTELERAVTDAGDLVRGRLDIGIVTAYSGPALFDSMARFHRTHPEVAFEVSEGQSSLLIDRVRAGDLDVALVGVADEPPRGLRARVLVRDRLVVGVPPDHPVAQQQTVTLSEVCGHALVSLPAGNGIRAALDAACAAHGVTASVALEASAPEAVREMAARGLGVAVLSESSLHPSGSLIRIPIADAEVRALLALVWRPGPSPAVRRWLAMAGDLGFGAPAS